MLDLLFGRRPAEPPASACPPASYAKATRVFERIFGRPPAPGDDPVGSLADLLTVVADELRARLERDRRRDLQREFEVSCAAGR